MRDARALPCPVSDAQHQHDHTLFAAHTAVHQAAIVTRAVQRELGDLDRIAAWGHGDLPICMAKTPLSLSDDPSRRGTPKGFRITVRGVRLNSGAGFLVVLLGDVMTMPGLPKAPSASRIDLTDDGKVVGLF